LFRKMIEVTYYEIIKKEFEELFKEKSVKAYFEITAKETFSSILKTKIPSGGEIIYQAFTLANFDEQKGEFLGWFEDDPSLNPFIGGDKDALYRERHS
jgi:hypothetical protein